MWNVDLIEVPADGSCFFASIAVAMNDCLMQWADKEYFCLKMKEYIEQYEEEYNTTLYEMTSNFIRYICAKNIDKCIFEHYCEDTKEREDIGEKDIDKFETMEEMSDHIRNSNCWADLFVIRAFFNAFETRCSLVIFDESYGGIVYFQKEWTENKDMYICLQRQSNHYRPMKLKKEDEYLPMCLTRESMLELVKFVQETSDFKVDNVF